MLQWRLLILLCAFLLSGCAEPIRNVVHGFQETTGCTFVREADEQACRQRAAEERPQR